LNKRFEDFHSWVDLDIRMIAGGGIQVFATFWTEPEAVRPADRLNRNIQKQMFSQDRGQVENAAFGNVGIAITDLVWRVYKQIVQLCVDFQLEREKAPNALQVFLSTQVSMRIDPIAHASQARGALEVGYLEIVPDLKKRDLEVKVAAVSDVLGKQESDIQPQRVTIDQVRTAW
jgi:hypothetical protein